MRGGRGTTDKFEIVIDFDGRRYTEDDAYEDYDFCKTSAQRLKNRFTDSMRVYIRRNGTILEEIEKESALRWLIDNYAS